ncbi:hypothetical protein ACFWOL_06620 [Streptomyces sp. NPDC058442]|uniref:hypothetical protein n=1 Tax=Streptomyces sp. NPDC058442 TaxID=3346503 RepID=UPI00365D455A
MKTGEMPEIATQGRLEATRRRFVGPRQARPARWHVTEVGNGTVRALEHVGTADRTCESLYAPEIALDLEEAGRASGQGAAASQRTEPLVSVHGVLALRPSQKALPKLVGTMALARCGLPTASITPVTVSLTIKVQPAR